MKRRTKITAIGASALALGAGGAGVALATGGDSSKPIPAPAIDQASAAALDHMGGGKVTGTEVGDEQSYYEVEVTSDDGTQTDVQLNRAFDVVSSESDGKGDSESASGD